MSGFQEDPHERERLRLPTLLGESLAIREVRSQVRKFAGVNCDVLITGETGTGKELVASLLHTLSARACRPFVAVNCAEFTHELVGAELFGHAAGAFTGAIRKRRGLIQSAHGGTLFFDEIGEIPLNTQAALLRVLETRTVRPLGSNAAETVDVRLVAATNQALQELVVEGRMRADFYHRIRIGRIHLPALRARPEDIHVLLEHFLTEMAQQWRRPTPSLCDEVRDAFLRAPWRGNVRELRNELAGAFALSSNDVIQWSDLSTEFRQGVDSQVNHTDATAERIRELLEENYWNVSLTARSLGISRQTLYRRMQNHRIAPRRGHRRAAHGTG